MATTTTTTPLRYPTGVRPLLIEETARRRRIEARVVALLECAAFAEIILPIIDFAEPYAGLRGNARQTYRFTDREGELVGIRSDFTPMVARALAPSLDGATPLRVFYRGDVIRCDASRLAANRELFQIGAEILGDRSPEVDAEMLRLAAAIASLLTPEPLVVYSGVERFLGSSEFLGSSGAGAALPRNSEEPRTRGTSPFVLYEGEEPDDAYYTGLRFWVYGADRRTPIAQGGRYDDLYARFGTAAPAVGFTFTVD